MSATYSSRRKVDIFAVMRGIELLTAKVDEISNGLTELEKLKEVIVQQQKMLVTPKWLSVDDLIDYLPSHPNKDTVYNWTRNNVLPYYRLGKHIHFLTEDVDAWLASKPKVPTKKPTKEEEKQAIQTLAEQYIKSHPIKH